jgi:DNA helicase IV
LPPAIKVWQYLHQGLPASAKDIKPIYQTYLPTGKRIKRGFKKLMQALPDDEVLTLNCLIENYGLLCDLPWDQAFEISDRLKAYLQKAFANDKSKTRIEITTIHATKGREADNVVVLPDMSWTTWNSFKENSDTEHRTFYVACTRAKNNLYIHQPISDNFYQYPS